MRLVLLLHRCFGEPSERRPWVQEHDDAGRFLPGFLFAVRCLFWWITHTSCYRPRFRMLKDGTRVQIDLNHLLDVDKILLRSTPLEYHREENFGFIDFPETLRAGRVYSIDFYYSGYPVPIGRCGSLVFDKDPAGRPWVYTACEEVGASMWWPNKDQWHEEVQNMRISVSIPNNLIDVSNGRLMGKTDLGDGYTILRADATMREKLQIQSNGRRLPAACIRQTVVFTL